jgi:hypothetical protein
MVGCALRDAAGWLRHAVTGHPADAFRHQMMLVYFAGYFSTRVRDWKPIVQLRTLRRAKLGHPSLR